jgi:hypothetical protein
LIWGAVRNGKLVAEPTIEPFFWVGQLFSPIDPVPGDLTQTPIDSKSKRDWKDPKRIKEKNAGGNKNLKKGLTVKNNSGRLGKPTVWQQDRCSL